MSEAPTHLDRHQLSAAYYADRAFHERLPVVENVCLARDTFRIRLKCPQLARRIVPGQFVMLRLPECDDPLLGRPFALYDTWFADSTHSDADASAQASQGAGGQVATGDPLGIDVVYLVVGKMTRRLAQCAAGDELEVWGPLGNGFSATSADRCILVAGGIGQTPFLALGRELLGGRQYGDPRRTLPPARQVTVCYGARSADYLAGVEDFEAAGMQVRISTDDGSAGRPGLVTELLTEALGETGGDSVRVACCGPEPMMEAVPEICTRRQVDCEASLETPMACGIGICFSCVAKIRQEDGSWDYKRTCVEGPVFDAAKIVW